MSACHEGESYYRSESFSLSRRAVPSKPGTCWRGCRVQKKDGGDHLLSTNTQHIARLGREVQPVPAKEGRKGADGLTRGVMFGTEGSIPSLGTTAVMRTTAQRQNSSSEGRSRTSHKAGNRINGGSNPPPATKRSDALHEVIIGLG